MANVTTPGIKFDGLDARLNGNLTLSDGSLNITQSVGTETFKVTTVYDRVGKFISSDANAFLAIQDSNSTDNGVGINVAGDQLKLLTGNSAGLTVESNQEIKFNAYGSGTFTGTPTYRLAVDSTGDVIEIPIGGGPVDGSGTANYFTMWTDSDTIGNGPASYSSGDGLTTFSSDLKITNSTPYLYLYDNGNGAGGGAQAHIIFQNTVGNAIGLGYTADNTSSSDLIISTDGSSTYGGYLGLDAGAILDTQADIILDPKSKVHVTKNIDIYKYTNTSGSATGSTLLTLSNNVGTESVAGDLNQQKTFIDFSLYDSNSNEVPQVRIGAEVGQNGNADSQVKEGSGAFIVYTNNATGNGPSPTGLNERLRVDYQGRVGIGTATPEYTIDTGETTIGTLRMVGDTNHTFIRLGAGSGGNDVTLIRIDGETNNHDGESDLGQYGFSLKYLGTLSGNENALALYSDNSAATSQVESFRVKQDGKLHVAQDAFFNSLVGIGVTSPAAKLEVRIGGIGSSANDEVDGVIFEGDRHDLIYKQIRTAASSDWNSTTVRLQTRVDTTLMSSIDFTTDASYNRHIDINTASNTFNTRFTHDGKVGIGTTSPNNKLQVVGNVEATRYIATNGNMLQLHVDSWNSGQTDHYVLYNGWTSGTGDYLLAKSSGNQNGNNGAILIADGNSGRIFFGRHGNQSAASDSATAPLSDTFAYIGGTGNLFEADTRINGTVGINMAAPSAYQFATSYTQTNPDDDFRFAHFIDANFEGADNTTGDREQGGIYIDIDSTADGDGTDEHRLYGIYIDQRFSGFSDQAYGVYSRVESNNVTEQTGALRAVYGFAIADNSNVNGGVGAMAGGWFDSYIEDMGDVNTTYGVFSRALSSSSRTTNVETTIGVHGEVQIDSPNAISYGTMYAFRAQIDNNEGSVPTFGNQYLYYGEHLGTKGSNAYGLYLVDEDKNYISGNLGIGVSNPDNTLDIDSNFTNSVQIRGTGSYSLFSYHDSGGVGWATGSGTSYDNLVYLDAANDKIHFYTAQSNRMTIHSDGVGIGITTPDDALEIYGSQKGIKISNTAENAAGILWVDVQDEGQQASIKYDCGDNNLKFYNSTTERMRIDSGGNVGIGTTSPATKLDVDGVTTAQSYKFNGNDTNPTTTAAKIYDLANVGLTASAHNFSIRNYNGSSMVESARFTTSSLTVIGDVIAFGSPSDISLKENIKPIENALDKVEKLQGVKFNWKEQGITNLNEDIGFIAQDVQEVLPELVRKNENGKLSLRHQGIVPVLVEAIKELKQEIETLKTQINN